MLAVIQKHWFGNIRGDLLAGLIVALTLIPEAIAFSVIAGVDPKVGLYASFCIAVVIAFAGGRPGMISAATGAMALLMVTPVKEYGLEYLLAANLLTGVFQIVVGYLMLGSLMRFVSRSVVTGFVNALAILIVLAPVAGIDRRYLARIRDDRRRPGDHLPLPLAYQGGAIAPGDHRGADRDRHGT